MRIFVSHRRKPTATSDFLEERLRERFGQHAVVRPASPAAGAPKAASAQGKARRKAKHRGRTKTKAPVQRAGQAQVEAVDGAQVVLVLIDEGWAATVQSEGAQPRAHVERALSAGKAVVPVLLDGAEMPGVDELPESLQPLVALEARSLTLPAADAEHQAQRVIDAITVGAERRMRWAAKERAVQTAQAEAAARSQAKPWPRFALVAAVLLVLLIGLPVWFASRRDAPQLERDISAATDAEQSSRVVQHPKAGGVGLAAAVEASGAVKTGVVQATAAAERDRAAVGAAPTIAAPTIAAPTIAAPTIVADQRNEKAGQLEQAVVVNGEHAAAVVVPAAYQRADKREAQAMQPGAEAHGGEGLAERMMMIPGGSFRMGTHRGAGDEDEVPVHDVVLRAFLMDRTEVTVSAYRACIAAGACEKRKDVEWGGEAMAAQGYFGGSACNLVGKDRGEHPVNCVSWHDAKAFCEFRGARLPTEAEWEYAAQGEVGYFYPWGNGQPNASRLNACGTECAKWAARHEHAAVPMYEGSDGYPTTAPVGSYPEGVSRFGLQDMAGNVWEWVADWHGPYHWAPQDNPTGPTQGTSRVMRGGGYFTEDEAGVRRENRLAALPQGRTSTVGFRCVRDVQ